MDLLLPTQNAMLETTVAMLLGDVRLDRRVTRQHAVPNTWNHFPLPPLSLARAESARLAADLRGWHSYLTTHSPLDACEHRV